MQSISEINKLPIVFIIGKGRSGTSLLQNLFNANPSVITAHESPLIMHLKQKYYHVNNWTSILLDEFITDLYKETKFSKSWKIDKHVLRKQIDQYPLSSLDFSILCKLIYLTISSPYPKGKISLIVDKNPKYSIFINELKEIFPEAKFIHLIRDYRDNVLSSKKAFKVRDVSLLAQRWKRYNIYIESIKKENTNIFYTIQYEHLVTDPEKYLPEICSFTNIKYDKKMLNFHETTSKIYSKDTAADDPMTRVVHNIHQNLLNPINSSRIEKWMDELTPSEIEIIDYIAGAYAEKKYGYVPTTKKFRLYFLVLSIRSLIKYYFSITIFKNYYSLPFSVRNLSRKSSLTLYKKFGYINKYNKIDVSHHKD